MRRVLVITGIVLLVLVVFFLISGFPIMWLWNWLMPELFGLKTITFWQAVGLNCLTTLLFRSGTDFSKK